MYIYILIEYNMLQMSWRFHGFIKSSGFKSIGAHSQSLNFPWASVSQYIGEMAIFIKCWVIHKEDGIYR